MAGFKLNMERKMTHYLITYYLPSGLFVVVSWASFLIPSDDIQVMNIFSCIFKHLFMQLSHHVIKSVIIHVCQNMLSKQIDFTVIDHNMEDCLLAGLAIQNLSLWWKNAIEMLINLILPSLLQKKNLQMYSSSHSYTTM